MIRTYFHEPHDLGFGDAEERLLPLLSARRQDAIGRYLLARDKRLSLCAGLLLRHVLQDLHGVPAQGLDLGWTEEGKPFLRGSRTRFNLSHCKTAVFLAVSDGAEVGVDVEAVTAAPVGVLRRIACGDEGEAVTDDVSFFELWTRKEAFLKCIGTGLLTDPRTVDTRDPALAARFHTMFHRGCVVSVYSEDREVSAPLDVSEGDLTSLFLPAT